jgi:AcrR family transcriptional regulator
VHGSVLHASCSRFESNICLRSWFGAAERARLQPVAPVRDKGTAMMANPQSNIVKESGPISKKDLRVAKIYTTAAAIIERDGYDATSLSNIAKAVGLTKAGLYHYIPSKENLLFGIMSYGMDRVDQRVIFPTQTIADPAERIRTLIANYIALMIEDGQAMTIVITERQALPPKLDRVIAKRRRAFYRYVHDTVQEIKRSGRAPVLDPTVTARSIFGVLISFAQWYRPTGRLPLQQIVDEIITLTVDRMIGLKIPAGSKLAESGGSPGRLQIVSRGK